jgi:hypothetical protein
MNHRVAWGVTLSNGESFSEGETPFEEVAGEPSPWNRLLDYMGDARLKVTAIWLTTPGGATHHLPSMQTELDPQLAAFHSAPRPSRLRCFRKAAGNGRVTSLFTIAEAQFRTHKVQLFVNESDPDESWSTVIPRDPMDIGTVAEWTADQDINPQDILGWVIWYADGSKYSSRDHVADDLPDDGVQGVRVFHRRPGSTTIYKFGMTGCDPYWLPGATRPKAGTWVTNDEHDRFTELMRQERW